MVDIAKFAIDAPGEKAAINMFMSCDFYEKRRDVKLNGYNRI